MTKKVKITISAAVVLCVALLAGVYFVFGTKDNAQTQTEKSITISVVDMNGETTDYELDTTAEYLSQAMTEAEGLTFSGSQGPYGIMLEEINGIRAVYEEDGAYWSVLVNGEYGMYGVDSQIVEDGSAYSLVYTVA